MTSLLSRLDRLPLNGSLTEALALAQTLAAPACPVLTASGLPVCQEVQLRAPAVPGDTLELWAADAEGWARVGSVLVPGLGVAWTAELEALADGARQQQPGRWAFTLPLTFR